MSALEVNCKDVANVNLSEGKPRNTYLERCIRSSSFQVSSSEKSRLRRFSQEVGVTVWISGWDLRDKGIEETGFRVV